MSLLDRASVKVGSTCALALLLSACGGGGSTEGTDPSASDNDTKTVTGTFVDSPVEGLYYETSSGDSGRTNASGEFSAPAGDVVTFRLGGSDGVLLGAIRAESGLRVTPLNVVPDYEHSASSANIARLIQSFDEDDDKSNGIQLPPDDQLPSAGQVDVTQSETDFENEAGSVVPLESKSNALKHLSSTLSSAYGSSTVDLAGTQWDVLLRFESCSESTYETEYTVSYTDSNLTIKGNEGVDAGCNPVSIDQTIDYGSIGSSDVGFERCLPPSGSCTVGELNDVYTYSDNGTDVTEFVQHRPGSGYLRSRKAKSGASDVLARHFRSKTIPFEGTTWAYRTTHPQCDKVATGTYEFKTDEVQIEGDELSTEADGTCTLSDLSRTASYSEVSIVIPCLGSGPDGCKYVDLNKRSYVDDSGDDVLDTIVDLTYILDDVSEEHSGTLVRRKCSYDAGNKSADCSGAFTTRLTAQ